VTVPVTTRVTVPVTACQTGRLALGRISAPLVTVSVTVVTVSMTLVTVTVTVILVAVTVSLVTSASPTDVIGCRITLRVTMRVTVVMCGSILTAPSALVRKPVIMLVTVTVTVTVITLVNVIVTMPVTMLVTMLVTNVAVPVTLLVTVTVTAHPVITTTIDQGTVLITILGIVRVTILVTVRVTILVTTVMVPVTVVVLVALDDVRAHLLVLAAAVALADLGLDFALEALHLRLGLVGGALLPSVRVPVPSTRFAAMAVAMGAENAHSESIHCHSHATDEDDGSGVPFQIHMVVLSQSAQLLDGFQSDHQANCEEKAGVRQRTNDFGPSPSERH